jgi:hypothetical protein
MGKSWDKLGKKELAVLYYKKASSILGNTGDPGRKEEEQELKAMEV